MSALARSKASYGYLQVVERVGAILEGASSEHPSGHVDDIVHLLILIIH